MFTHLCLLQWSSNLQHLVMQRAAGLGCWRLHIQVLDTSLRSQINPPFSRHVESHWPVESFVLKCRRFFFESREQKHWEQVWNQLPPDDCAAPHEQHLKVGERTTFQGLLRRLHQQRATKWWLCLCTVDSSILMYIIIVYTPLCRTLNFYMMNPDPQHPPIFS